MASSKAYVLYTSFIFCHFNGDFIAQNFTGQLNIGSAPRIQAVKDDIAELSYLWDGYSTSCC